MRGLGRDGDPSTSGFGAATIKKITYTEFDIRDGGSPNEAFDHEMAESTRIVDIDPWDNRISAAFQILGFPQRVMAVNPGSTGPPTIPFIKRYLPEYHPELPYMVADKITNIKGLGARGFNDVNVASVPDETNADANGHKFKRVAKYQMARISFHMEFPTYDVLADTIQAGYFPNREDYRFVTTEYRPAAEKLSIPSVNGGFAMKWTNDPGEPPVGNPAQDSNRVKQVYPANIGLVIGNVDFKWTWHQVPFDSIPDATILDTLGRVNCDTILGQPPGTLLLLACDIQRKNSPFGLRTYNIQYTARYNPRQHNRYYDPVFGRWCQISKDGTYYPPASVGGDGEALTPNSKLPHDLRPFAKLFVPK